MRKSRGISQFSGWIKKFHIGEKLKIVNFEFGEKGKILTMAILLSLSIFLTLYFHHILNTLIAFTHFFYIPVIFASLWWQKRGVLVAILLAAVDLFSSQFAHIKISTYDYLRSFMLTFVSVSFAIISDKLVTHHKELRRLVNEQTAELRQEIDRRKKIEEELRLANNYNRSLIETSLDPLIIIDLEGKIKDVNMAMEKVTCLSREKLIGTDFSKYFNNPEKAKEVYQKAIREFSSSDYSLKIIGNKGDYETPVLLNASVYRDNYGNVTGVFVTARDVTEYKRMEEQLLKSEKLAALGEAAGMVGHDLRNPLQSIENAVHLLNAELSHMQNYVPSPKIARMFEIIEDSLDYANKIIKDLQDFSSDRKPNLKSVELNSLIEETLEKIEIPENVKVVTEFCFIPQIRVDPNMIRRVIYNLVVNGIQAMEKRGGLLKITTKAEKDHLVITFEDNGEGIPQENLTKIFTPFYTTKAKGIGLGLSICKKFVELHGGHIEVKSKIGVGSIFMINLPLNMEVTG